MNLLVLYHFELVKIYNKLLPSVPKIFHLQYGTIFISLTCILHQCIVHIGINLSQQTVTSMHYGLCILKRSVKIINGLFSIRFLVIANLLIFAKPMNGNLHGSMRQKKNPHKTQVGGSIHAVSINPGIRTPFTWYSLTKGVGKIGEHDIGWIVRLCTYMDKLISQKNKFNGSTSKCKKNKAKRLDKAVACMR